MRPITLRTYSTMWLTYLFILFGANICLGDVTRIVRPCKYDDFKCIGDNLAANSKCSRRVRGSFPSEYSVPEFHFDTPAFNSSYIDKNMFVRNQDKCRIAEFFFDTVTDQVVLGLECRNIVLESDRTYIQHKTFQEDSLYYYHIKATYPLLRFTINLPSISRMDLCSASIFSDVVMLPKLKIDPKTKKTDKALSRDLSLLDIYERENFNQRGRAITFLFVDYMLCDYGCPLPS